MSISSSSLVQASIVAVGTELITGQIINRNAAWISEQLESQGIPVVLHLTVADHRDEMLKAFRWAAEKSQLIFVTGGLGPTTDDFTREVVSAWVQQPLEYQESEWIRIQERLTQRGVPVASSNRQQCFFPKNSEILFNPAGTAAGFYYSDDEKKIWVLPGPPNELQAIWNYPGTGIQARLERDYPDARVQLSHLLTWQCLGKSEAELGELTELALKDTGFQTGYRYHSPWIEIKVWVPKDSLSQPKTKLALEKLETAIQPWLFARGKEDLAENLLHALSHFTPFQKNEGRIHLLDTVTGGLLTTRLASLLKRSEWEKIRQKITIATQWSFSPLEGKNLQAPLASELFLELSLGAQKGEVCVKIQQGTAMGVEKRFLSPYAHALLNERHQAYSAERAFQIWGQALFEFQKASAF